MNPLSFPHNFLCLSVCAFHFLNDFSTFLFFILWSFLLISSPSITPTFHQQPRPDKSNWFLPCPLIAIITSLLFFSSGHPVLIESSVYILFFFRNLFSYIIYLATLGLGCSRQNPYFPDQGLNTCCLHWECSQSLDHQAHSYKLTSESLHFPTPLLNHCQNNVLKTCLWSLITYNL